LAVIGEHITYDTRGVDRPAYLARAEGRGRLPGVLVIHEIFGLTPHIEDVARRFADAGYVALAPDLFVLGGRPVSNAELEFAMRFMRNVPREVWQDQSAAEAKLADRPKSDRDATLKGLEWRVRRDMDAHTPDMMAAVEWLARQPYVDPNLIGCVGFCMGGALSIRLAAAGAPLAACVIFYGNNPPLDRVAAIRCPVLGLYGGDDHRITDDVPAFAEAMAAANKLFEYHVYLGAGHAFFNDSRPETYRPDAARDAWPRVLAFFGTHLRGD